MKIKEPFRIFIAGMGGEGVTFLGRLLCYAAVHENRHAAMVPQYQRTILGGLIQVRLLIATDPISIPFMSDYNVVLYLHPKAKELEISLADSHLSLDAEELNAQTIARKTGFSQGSNMVVLGALLAKLPICSDYTIAWALKQWLGRTRSHELAMNLQLLEKGTHLL